MGADGTVERFAFEVVDYAVAVAVLGQLFVARLVGFVITFDIVGKLSGCFVGELSDIGLVVD